MNIPNEFRWGTGIKHAALAFLTCLLVGVLVLAVSEPANAEKYGEGVGRMSSVAFLFALAASWGKQTGRSFAFLGGSIAAGIFVLLPGLIPLFFKPAPPLVMLPEEKADLETVDGLLCQKALDWGFDDPGSRFGPEPQAQQQLIDGLAKVKVVGHAWAWLDEEAGQMLMAQMLKTPMDKATFEGFAKGLRRSLAAAPGTKIGRERLETLVEPFRYETDFQNANGGIFDMICQSAPPSHPVQGIACITSGAADHEALREVRESARFGCS